MKDFKKYKSCHILQHGLCFFHGAITSCCFSPVGKTNNKEPLTLYDIYAGENFNSNNLFEKINNYNILFKNGSCPKDCLNCYHIEEKNWDENKYIDYITITHFYKCSANCIYCTNNIEHSRRTNNTYKEIYRSSKFGGKLVHIFARSSGFIILLPYGFLK